MTRDEVREKRKAIEEEAAEVREKMDIIHGKLQALQRRCTHPALRKSSAMGDIGTVCDDCGYQT